MNLRRPIIAALLACALLAIYVVDKRVQEKAFIIKAAEDRVLIFDPAQVTHIKIHGPGGDYALEREGAKWFLREPSNFRADKSQVDALIGNVIGARKSPPFVPSDLATYGLDPADTKFEITVAGKNGAEVHTIEFGKARSDGGRVYARTNGGKEIFTVGDWVPRQGDRTLNDWRNHTLSDGLPPGATSFEIASARGDVSLIKKDNRWRFRTNSLEGPADNIMVENALLSLERGRMTEVIDKPTSTPMQLGFERPIVTVSSGSEKILTVGRMLPGSGNFSVSIGDGAVGIATPEVLREFLRAPLEWSSKRFVWGEHGDVTGVTIRSGSAELVLKTENGKWLFADTVEVPVNQDRARLLWKDITELAAVRLIEGPRAPDAPTDPRFKHIQLAVRVQFADGAEQGFDFGVTDVREGITYVRRSHDDTIWGVDFTASKKFFKFRADLEERRLIPALAAKTKRIELRTDNKQSISFDMVGNNWRIKMPNGKSVMAPLGDVESFLTGIEDLEWSSAVLNEMNKAPFFSFSFYAEGEAEPFHKIEMLDTITGPEGNVTDFYVKTASGIFLVNYSEYQQFDQPLLRLLRFALNETDQKAPK